MRVAAVAALLAAQALAAQMAAKPDETGSIEGRVTNALTGEPIPKAGVAAENGFRNGQTSAVTDLEGKFVLAGLAAGSYSVYAEREGFVIGNYGARKAGDRGASITLAAGQKFAGADVRLTPLAILSGRVFDSAGDPFTGAEVYVLRERWENGKRSFQQVGSATTNDLGEYRFSRLQPGRYYVSAAKRRVNGEDRSARPPADVYVTTYYPGSEDLQAAVALEAAAGKPEREVNIQLIRAPAGRVAGRLVNHTGMPGASLYLRPEGLFGSLGKNTPVTVEPDGRFEARRIPPGSYWLVAEIARPLGGGPQTVKPVEVRREPVEDLVITLIPQFQIAGTVRAEDGVPKLNGVQIGAVPNPVPDAVAMITAAGGTTVGEDGTFVLKGLNPARYRLDALGLPEGYYLKSVRMGGEEYLDKELDFSGGPSGALELVLSGKAGRLNGSVTDDKGAPAAGAGVALLRDSGSAQVYKIARTDQYGRFQFQGLPPAGYRLLAIREIDWDRTGDPNYLKPVEGKAVAVQLADGAAETRELKVVEKVEEQP